MALSSADNPMSAKPKKTKPEPVTLAKASTSGSAEVHDLLARREVAAGRPGLVAEIDAQLAELGFTV